MADSPTYHDAPPPGLPPAGWYADAGDAHMLRWWDGSKWGSATRAATDFAEEQPPISSARPAGGPTTEGQGTKQTPAGWEGWRTVVGIFMVLATLAVIGWMVYSAQHAGDDTQRQIDCIMQGLDADC